MVPVVDENDGFLKFLFGVGQDSVFVKHITCTQVFISWNTGVERKAACIDRKDALMPGQWGDAIADEWYDYLAGAINDAPFFDMGNGYIFIEKIPDRISDWTLAEAVIVEGIDGIVSDEASIHDGDEGIVHGLHLMKGEDSYRVGR